MNELDELYQELILDHNRQPRNFHELAHATHALDGYNPLCGDKLKLYLKIKNDVINDISFLGSGCAISTASSSLLTDTVKGMPIAKAKNFFRLFIDIVTGKSETESDIDQLGKLAALAGVKEFPVRVKCATLAWHTLNAILEGEKEPISTE